MNLLPILLVCLTIPGQSAQSTIALTSEMLEETRTSTSIGSFVHSRQQWISIARNSSLQWKRVNDQSQTFLLRSDGHCLSQSCDIQLRYNGSLDNADSACLTFLLWIHGQPIGQLWIEEDQAKESFSQKIQLTDSTLLIQHTFAARLQQLSINGRVLFQNAQLDTISLSDLRIDWSGPCRNDVSRNQMESTRPTNEEDWTMASTWEIDRIETTERFVDASHVSASTSLLDDTNLCWLLSFVIGCCFLLISLTFLYGLWSIQKHYHYLWHLRYDWPVQFLWRRSIRSSTRSHTVVPTVSQGARESSHLSSTSSLDDSVLI